MHSTRARNLNACVHSSENWQRSRLGSNETFRERCWALFLTCKGRPSWILNKLFCHPFRKRKPCQVKHLEDALKPPSLIIGTDGHICGSRYRRLSITDYKLRPTNFPLLLSDCYLNLVADRGNKWKVCSVTSAKLTHKQTDREIDRETDRRQTDKQTARQTDKRTEKHTAKQTEKQTETDRETDI